MSWKQPDGRMSLKPALPPHERPSVVAAAWHSAEVRLCRPVVSQLLSWLE